MKNTLITSSGVIKNRSKPRTGIVSINSLDSFVFDEIHNGIDLSFESWYEDQVTEVKEAFASRTDLSDDEREERIEQELQYRNDHYDNDGDATILFGGWLKNANGEYEIDRSKDYAAVYSSSSGNVSVEWSKTVKWCNNTSPCYVMADGSGPCGNLDDEGDAVLAYSLPGEYFLNEAAS